MRSSRPSEGPDSGSVNCSPSTLPNITSEALCMCSGRVGMCRSSFPSSGSTGTCSMRGWSSGETCRGRASAPGGGARPDRRLCQHPCLGPSRLPDGRLHLPQRAESPARGQSPRARELPHDAAPPSEGPHPRDPGHPRPDRERGDHPARLARPGLWPEPAAPASPVCEVRSLDRLNGRAPQEHISMTRVPLWERHPVTRVLAPGHQTVRDVCTHRPVGANHGTTCVTAVRLIYVTMPDKEGGLPTCRGP